MSGEWRAFLQAAVFLAVVLAVAFCFRVASIAGDQLEIAGQAMEKGDTRRAMLAYERSLHAWLPFLPACEQALKGMWELNKSLEKRGNRVAALEGWRRLRAALMSTRSIFGQPHEAVLQQANRHIARLAAATDTQGMMSRQAIEQEATQLLAENPKDISPFWGVMQFLLLLLWIGSTTWLIWNWAGFAVRQRMLAGGVSALSLMGWLGALYLAG